MGDWTLFSNHGHVLICLARNREARLRDVASDIGITERAVQKIVHELQSAGYIAISKHGRCNRYEISARKNLRHPLEKQCTVGKLLQLFAKPDGRTGTGLSDEPAAVEGPNAHVPAAVKTSATVPAPAAPKRPEPGESAKAEPDKPPSGKADGPKSDNRGPDNRNQGSLF